MSEPSREPEREPGEPNSDTAIHEANRLVRIADRCPKCGSQSLFIGSGGWITCSWIECKEPGLTRNLDAHQQALRELEEENGKLRAILTTPEVYVGVVTEACEKHWAAIIREAQEEIARLKEAAEVAQAHIDEADDLIAQHYARAIKAEARVRELEGIRLKLENQKAFYAAERDAEIAALRAEIENAEKLLAKVLTTGSKYDIEAHFVRYSKWCKAGHVTGQRGCALCEPLV